MVLQANGEGNFDGDICHSIAEDLCMLCKTVSNAFINLCYVFIVALCLSDVALVNAQTRVPPPPRARVAKLADAPDLGSGGEIRRGSSPLPGTMSPNRPGQAALSTKRSIFCGLKPHAISVHAHVFWFPTNGVLREMHSRFVPARCLPEMYPGV